nr:Chain E, Polyadenylate-binding protein 1 [Homo sapiens]5LGS_F Chain F, Polyadenylate-binding protein 1 [Homo sapiens]5LGS_G Chain G, Polyadenylate-binding protein 1 [Homo sapiens]5LGS_H Chain H, Polyadenylate-binding protein 1 [Homo sapiens]
PAAPRPPFS